MKAKSKDETYFSIGDDAHPTDVSLQFSRLAKELLGKEPNYLPYPSENPFVAKGDYPPSWIIKEVAPNVKQAIIVHCRMELPFGLVDFTPERLILLSGSKEAFVVFGTAVRDHALTNSIFKQHIINSRFQFLDWECPPVILRPDKQAEVDALLMLPLRSRERW